MGKYELPNDMKTELARHFNYRVLGGLKDAYAHGGGVKKHVEGIFFMAKKGKLKRKTIESISEAFLHSKRY
jgi:hypothetical protein